MVDDTAPAVAGKEPTREESGDVPVTSVNSAGGENAKQPPQAHTNSMTTSTRAAEEMANIGGEMGNPDRSGVGKPLLDACVGGDASGLFDSLLGVGGESLAAEAILHRKFPAEQPPKPTIVNIDERAYEQGYDSDGQLPYIFGYENDDPSNYSESVIPSSAPAVPAAAAPMNLSDEETLKFKVAELKTELAKRRLRGTGGKAALQ